MLKFDDQFPLHRKVAPLSDSAFRLHMEAIFWARRNLTDGFIPAEDLSVVSRARDSARACADLVKRDAWHRVADGQLVAGCNTGGGYAEDPNLSGRDRVTPARQDSGCAECSARHNGSLAGDGWVIHGYADWQQTRSKVVQVREVKQRSGRMGGIRSGQSRRGRRSTNEARGEAQPKQRASRSVAKQRTPSALSRAETARAALAPSAPRCPQHHDQPAIGCGTCRSEQIGAA